ncbi:MAG: MATE family efflux transporter [Lachnospiraceae bacterium]|nr:MATE family efflux transporter [Lachnospiraceae bacterium]
MNKEKNLEVFRSAPVPQAIMKNALPAMAAMLMVLIYNLADMFFIGQTHNALMVAAVSLATPIFLLFMSIGTMFGIGGTSVISRALGEGRTEYAKKVCSFCMWGCVAAGVGLSVIFLIFMNPLLRAIGASEETWHFTKTYLTIVVCAGPLSVLANCFSCILRAEGEANKAMIGQLGGNLINVILDPLFILAFNWGVAGAAIATVIGNAFGACYYMQYFLRGKSMLSIHPRDFSVKERIPLNVLSIGVPASLASLLMSVAQMIVNSFMAGYSDMALAGNGVAMKATMITGMVCIGFGQGIQPLLGYCVGAGLWDRFRQVMKTSCIIAISISASLTILCYIFTGPIVRAFVTEPAAYEYGVTFTRILLTTSFLFGLFYVVSNTLQAMGAALPAFIVNLSRQALIYIPSVFILNRLIGMNGLVWAQPVADVLSTILVFFFYFRTVNKMMAAYNNGTPEKEDI